MMDAIKRFTRSVTDLTLSEIHVFVLLHRQDVDARHSSGPCFASRSGCWAEVPGRVPGLAPHQPT
jgi:hypothetical protein